MPINVGNFYIRQPRVSSINAITTKVPPSSGTFSFINCFSISYIGSGLDCFLYVTGTKILTICNEDQNNSDNLNISTTGLKISEVINKISQNTNYTVNILTTKLEEDAYFETVLKTNIKNNQKIIKYNSEKEYSVEVLKKGNLGSAKVNIKTENLTYDSQLRKWVVDEGFIFDQVGVNVPSNGITSVGSDGLKLNFKKADNENSLDLENLIIYNDIELIRSVDQDINNISFEIAPLIKYGGILEKLVVNQIPSGSSYGISWSEDTNFLAVSHANFPYLTIYQRQLDSFIRLDSSSNLSPGIAKDTKFSHDGNYLAVCYDFYPYLDIYKKDENTFIKINSLNQLPPSSVNSIAWDKTGTKLILGLESDPFTIAYNRFNDTFTLDTSLNFNLKSKVNRIFWSDLGNYLIFSTDLYPFLSIFYVENNNFSLISVDPPENSLASAKMDSSEKYLVCVLKNYPFLEIYKRSDNFFSKINRPYLLPNSECLDCSWSPDGTILSVTQVNSPKIINYKVILDFFEKIDNIEDFPATLSRSLAWSPNGNYLALTQNSNPNILIYKFYGDFKLYLNQNLIKEGKNYFIDYGTAPELIASNEEPYIFSITNNVLKVRWNSESIQNFTFETRSYSSEELALAINSKAVNFKAKVIEGDQNKKIVLIGNKGSSYHQLRIENGSANSVLGFNNLQSKKGSGFSQLTFLNYIEDELISSSIETDNFTLSGFSNLLGNNPFLGIYLDSVSLSENNEYKIKDKDFVVDESGNINLISKIEEKNLLGNVLKLDTELFPSDYTLYKDGLPLVENVDYTINLQGGWINLEEGALPGSIFEIDYVNAILGKIEKEVIVGEQAKLIGSNSGSFFFGNKNIFKIKINNQPEQIFILPELGSVTTNALALLINQTAVNFKCYICNNKLEIRTNSYGPKSNITITDGSANEILGFNNFQATSGIGALGGETSLEVKNPPLEIVSFTAPEGGDTIIIKNNDIRSRYNENSVIKLIDDYYIIKESFLETKANLISPIGGPFTILQDSNDIFKFIVDDEDETVVTFEEGFDIPISNLVDAINEVRPLTAKLLILNGAERIQLIGNTSIKVTNGSANRTFGFEDDSFDSSIPDSYLKILGKFKSTYVAPETYTTINVISFNPFYVEKIPSAKGSNILKLYGDLTSIFNLNKLIRINNFVYKIISSSLNGDYTEVVLHQRLDINVLEDTLIFLSDEVIYEEGNVNIKVNNLIYTDLPFYLYKNNNLLVLDQDYSATETGEIELSEGISFGDIFKFEYTARRFCKIEDVIKCSYSYFYYLPRGANLKYSLSAINPDNFYVNVLHGSTILDRLISEVSSNLQSSLGSRSSGFPTGEVSETPNDESGVGTFEYVLGDLENKIDIALKIFSFYDNRLKFFEDEKLSINGFIVGAESGRVTSQQIIDSATKTAPQRLFPSPDNRPFEQRTEPLRVPALDGINKNDSLSDAQGISSSYLNLRLNQELSELNSEKDRLNILLGISNSSSTLDSTGDISSIRGETIILYVEASNSGSLVQRTVSIVLPTQRTSSIFGGSTITFNPTAEEVRDAINNAVDNNFSGLTVRPASVVSGRVRLTSSSSTVTKCCLVIQDTPNLGFGTGKQASIRSRHTLYTAGATYATIVPGTFSVHLNNTNSNSRRTNQNTLHNNQITNLEGQMQEWLTSFEQSFVEAKNEKMKVNIAKQESENFTNLTNTFLNLKFSDIFGSISNNSTIQNRITSINSRILEINRRLNELTSRISEIGTSLSRENLYNARFSWVILLADKSSGYYAKKEREINFEEKNKRTVSNNTEALNSLNLLV